MKMNKNCQLRVKFSIILVLVGFLFIDVYNVYLSETTDGSKSTTRLEQETLSDQPSSDDQEILSLQSECQCRKHQVVSVLKNKKRSTVSVNLFNTDTSTNKMIFRMTERGFNSARFLCDPYKVLRRGLGQKVIAFSLYGRDKAYYNKLTEIARQIRQLYGPEWFMRVYYDSSIDRSIICQLECETAVLDIVDFCSIENLFMSFDHYVRNESFSVSYAHGMSWRWLPIGDSYVDAFSSRDSDSHILQREVDSVMYWLESKKAGHVMRDHPLHNAVMLGGMWGFHNSIDRKLANMIFIQIIDKSLAVRFNLNGHNTKGLDQNFLSKFVYGALKDNVVVHDSFLCTTLGGEPWPSQRVGNCYVGAPTPCSTNSTDFPDCPLDCRNLNHTDWLKC